LDTSIFVAFSTLLYFLFVRKNAISQTGEESSRVKPDLRSKVIIFTYFLSMLFSCVNWNYYIIKKSILVEEGDNNKEPFELYSEFIDLATVELVVINLQVIVFEMYSLYVTLTSMSKE